jgi:foldase protein PrsA
MTGCGHKVKLSNGKEVVADFNGKSITIDSLYEQVKNKYARDILIDMIDTAILDKKYPTDDAMVSEIDSQIEYIKQQTKNQFLDAIKYYYGVNSEEEFRTVLALNSKRSKAANDYVKSIVTDKEINDYYKTEIVGDIKASHILIKPDVTDDMDSTKKAAEEAKALQLAKDIITKLNNGEKFADLAKKYSEDSVSASKGGDLGYFNKGKMDSAFEKAAFDLKKGEYTKTPVKSQFGYHIILKVDEKTKPTLNVVKNDIIDSLTEDKLTNDTTLSSKALIELRKDNKLKIYDTELQKQYDNYMKQLLTKTSTTTK